MSTDNYRHAVSQRSPSYERVAQSLLNDIESGRYPIDALLPTEAELAQQFGLSRHTVREALRRLQQMGVVSRKQGVGTHVTSISGSTGYVQRAASIADLTQYAHDVRFVLDSTHDVTADEALAQQLNCRSGQRWLKLLGLRYKAHDETPICYTEVYISYEFASIRDEIRDSHQAIYELIQNSFGVRISEVQQRISAIGLPPELATPLCVEAGSAALHIGRYYHSDKGRIVEVAFSTYPAGRFAYMSRLTLDTAGESGR